MTQSVPIYLPLPRQGGGMALAEAIVRRRSIREFSPQAISQALLSQILWAAHGTTDARGWYRTIPSAGATYPLEVIVVCGGKGVEGIDDGMYQRLKTYACRIVSGEPRPGIEPEVTAGHLTIAQVGWFDLRDPASWGSPVLDDPITYPLLQRLRSALGYATEEEAV